MNCEDAECALNALLDSEDMGVDRHELEFHLNSCRACTDLREQLAVLDKHLQTSVPPLANSSSPDRLAETLGLPRRQRLRWEPMAAAAVLLIGFFLFRPSVENQGWNFEVLQGRVSLDGQDELKKGVLRRGEWLQIPEGARAKLSVAKIGHVELESGTRVRMTATSETSHQLEMTQGRLSAVVDAPPRLFLVKTPKIDAVDLGCAYTLTVAEDGTTELEVTLGKVSLESKQGVVVVPAGAMCRSGPTGEPGIPRYTKSTPAVVNLCNGLEQDPRDLNDADFVTLVRLNRLEDALPLVSTLRHLSRDRRERAVDSLLSVAPAVDLPNREDLLQLKTGALESYVDAVDMRLMVGLDINDNTVSLN